MLQVLKAVMIHIVTDVDSKVREISIDLKGWVFAETIRLNLMTTISGEGAKVRKGCPMC